MKKLYVLLQDSAILIDPSLVINKLDPSIKGKIVFARFPFTPPGKMIEEVLKEIFDLWRKDDPESHILLITSSVIYGPTIRSGTTPEKLAYWLKSNFKNSLYAIRSGGYVVPPRGNIDFGFKKTPEDKEGGVANNILEVYKTIPE